MERLKQLGKDSVIYGLGGILARSISFLTLPIYTRIFSPAEYGTIEMLTVLSSFLATILGMGMDSAQSMYFFKRKGEGKAAQARIVSGILQWRLIWGTGIVITATVAAPLLNATFFNGKLSFEYFAIAFSSALFAQILSQSEEVMRLLYRPWSYIGITLSYSLLAAGLVLLFVLAFDQGVLGFFLGAAVASPLVALFAWFRIRDYLDFSRLHVDLWPQLLRFGAPLVPAGLAMYFMNTADRWFLQYYHGGEVLGTFAIGAKFAMLMGLAIEALRRAWGPIAWDAMHSDDGPETFRLLARLYMGISSAAVLVLLLLSPWLVANLTGPRFSDSWPIVGILAWQPVFYGFYLIASAGIRKTEKMYLNIYLMGGASLIGVFLNWLFVPPWGAMGAALATALTYGAWITVSIIVSERLWSISFPMRATALQVIAAVAGSAWLLLVKNGQFDWQAWLGTFTLCTLLLWSSIPNNYRKFWVPKKDLA